MAKVFIDGQAGTTGLQIHERLARHSGVTLLSIDDAARKDVAARAARMNEADAVFLCLPDEAAVEAAALVTNRDTVMIDASTAHRVDGAWAYGLPELGPTQRERISRAKRIANPGCHATGFILAVNPLIQLGLVAFSYPFTCFSLSGYSGAGKPGIAQYEAAERPAALYSPRQYGLSLCHKHLPEMQRVPGLSTPPLFNPVICDFYCGMAVSVPLIPQLMERPMGPDELLEALRAFYADSRLIEVLPARADGFVAANEMAGLEGLRLYVQGNAEQITLVSVFDNLGKGASGAAVQNMNLALGFDEYETLIERG